MITAQRDLVSQTIAVFPFYPVSSPRDSASGKDFARSGRAEQAPLPGEEGHRRSGWVTAPKRTPLRIESLFSS